MAEDTEVLDWSNEDDEQPFDSHRQHRNEPREDDEDAVSLGGDEDDMQVFYAYQSRSHQDAPKPALESSRPPQSRELQREPSGNSSKQPHPSPRSSPQISQAHAKLTHALPPKPVVTGSAFSLNSSQILEASAMARRTDRERRQSANGKSGSAAEEPLPPDWEARNSRNDDGEVYYYNFKTRASTWTRPVFDRGRATPNDRSRGAHDTWSPEEAPRNRSPIPERPGPRPLRGEPQTSSDGMSFDDRHYRPGGEVQAPGALVKDRSLPKKPAYMDPPRPLSPEFERPSRVQSRSARDDTGSARQPDGSRARMETSPHSRRPSSRRRDSNRDGESGGLALSVSIDSYRPQADGSRHHQDDDHPHFSERSSTSSTLLPSYHPPIHGVARTSLRGRGHALSVFTERQVHLSGGPSPSSVTCFSYAETRRSSRIILSLPFSCLLPYLFSSLHIRFLL